MFVPINFGLICLYLLYVSKFPQKRQEPGSQVSILSNYMGKEYLKVLKLDNVILEEKMFVWL